MPKSYLKLNIEIKYDEIKWKFFAKYKERFQKINTQHKQKYRGLKVGIFGGINIKRRKRKRDVLFGGW